MRSENALRLNVESEFASSDNPVMVVVRHKAGVLSWQLPLEVKTDIGELRWHGLWYLSGFYTVLKSAMKN